MQEHTNNPSTIGAIFARLDWKKVYQLSVLAVILISWCFAGYKLQKALNQFPDSRFIAFISPQIGLMLFSGIFAGSFIQHKNSQGVGIIATASTVLNAALV